RNQRGELDFQLGGHAKAGAALGLLRNSRADGRIGVAQENGAPGADVIEELVAVGVVQILAFAALDNERLAAHRAERAHRAVDAADEQFGGAVENLARAATLAVQACLRRAHTLWLTIARETPGGICHAFSHLPVLS